MRVLWRTLLILGTFLGAGYLTMHLLITRAVARGVPEVNVRLGGAVGGLFVGGAAASLLALALLLGGRKSAEAPLQEPGERS